MELWRHDGDRLVTYVWQSSVVQLQRALVIANSGGIVAHATSKALELRAHGAEGQQGTRLVLDMQKRLVEVVNLDAQPRNPSVSNGPLQPDVGNLGPSADDAKPLEEPAVLSKLRMRLTDLKCYRLPGEAVKVTGWP